MRELFKLRAVWSAIASFSIAWAAGVKQIDRCPQVFHRTYHGEKRSLACVRFRKNKRCDPPECLHTVPTSVRADNIVADVLFSRA